MSTPLRLVATGNVERGPRADGGAGWLEWLMANVDSGLAAGGERDQACWLSTRRLGQ